MRSVRIAALVLLLACAVSHAHARAPADSTLERELVARLESAGFEDVAVECGDSVVRVELENRVERNPARALGTIAALVHAQRPGACEVTFLQQGLPVARVVLDTRPLARAEAPAQASHALEGLQVEVLPVSNRPRVRGGAHAARRLDVQVRALLQAQFGHLREPFIYHLEISPGVVTQPWRGSLLRLFWTFPVSHQSDVLPSVEHPDLADSRPEEMALYQFFRPAPGWIANVGGGYLGGNRYGGTAGAAWVPAPWLLMEGSADLTGALSFRPEVRYSTVRRLTYSGSVTLRPTRPDVSLTLRAGRYLYSTESNPEAGEFAVRAEIERRFHQLGVGFLLTRSETRRYGGVRLDLPLPPSRRMRPGPVRLDVPRNFPVEYRTDETPSEVQPASPRLRSSLMQGLWISSFLGQEDECLAAFREALGNSGQTHEK